MKNMLLSMGLIATTGLVAQSNTMSQNSQDCCNPCKPCCVPKPKKNIDCECYNPNFFSLQCDQGFFVSAEFLYWYGTETNVPYAIETQNVLRNTIDNGQIGLVSSVKQMDAKWDPGVRASVGWNSPCDGWDLVLHYTWYKNSLSETSTLPEIDGEGNTTINGLNQFNPWASILEENAVYVPKIEGEWKFQLNNFDLEIGRRYWVNASFTLRPFVGFRGSWTATKFDVKSSRPIALVDTSPNEYLQTFSSVRFANKFWGAGFYGGLEPTWHLNSCFALFTGFDVALLWGQHSIERSESNITQSGLTPTSLIDDAHFDNISSRQNRFHSMQFIIDASIGLRWEDTWCNSRYRTALDLGWEHHSWINHNSRYTAQVRNITALSGSLAVEDSKYTRTIHTVSFGGFVLRAHLDF